MANFLKPSVVFLLVSLIVLANARQRDDDKTKPRLSLGSQQNDQSGGNVQMGGMKSNADGTVMNVDENGCRCGDAKAKEFMRKFMILLRAYVSKEFLPEVQNMAAKMGNFVMDYMAKEKPQQMDRINKFLENSAKATSLAVGKNSGKK